MPPTMSALGLDRLSPAERLALADELYASVPDESADPLSAAETAILDRRMAELDAEPAKVVTWDEIKAHARGRVLTQ